MQVPTLEPKESNDYLKKKPKDAIDDRVQSIMSMISYKDGKPQIMGSSQLTSQLFSADIDLFERVYESGSLEKAKRDIALMFRNMMSILSRKPNIYFMDFKAGIDEDLYLPEEDFQNPAKVRKFYKEKERAKLITPQNMKAIDALVKSGEEDKLYEYCRKLWTLRWKPDDIARGYLILSGNRKKTFEDSLDDKTVIKIDIVAHIDNQFIEFSNIFEIHVGSRVINLATTNIIESVKRDVEAFYKAKNWIKTLKRIFVIAKLERDMRLVKKLTILFNSNIGLLYKIKSDVGTLGELLEKGHRPIKAIHQAMQKIKGNLGLIYQFPLPSHFISRLEDLSREDDPEKLMNGLNDLSKDMLDKANEEALKYIKKYKIDIESFLPSE